MRNRETGIAERALAAFNKATGLRAVIEQIEPVLPGGRRADALIRLAGKGLHKALAAEIKTQLTTATLGAAIETLKRLPGNAVLITTYVNPNMAERLKETNVPFIDTVGNAYINEPPFMVYMKGQRPPKETGRIRPTRAFQPTGLKVIFAILCKRELMHATYRDIARAADVALGTVGWVVTDLKALGFWLDMGKRGRRLLQRERLVERWATGYAEQLRPKLLMGRFDAPNPDWWKQARLPDLEAFWGGEVAAARLTQYLKPELITLYVKDAPAKIQTLNKLKGNPHGKTELLKLFWKFDFEGIEADLVHPLLVYADLLATGDPRNIETARIIYELHLTGLVRED